MTRGRKRNESHAATRGENNIPFEIHYENASPEIPPPTKKHNVPPHNRSSNFDFNPREPRISSTAVQQPQILHFELSSCPTSGTGKPATVQSIGLGLGLGLTEEVKVPYLEERRFVRRVVCAQLRYWTCIRVSSSSSRHFRPCPPSYSPPYKLGKVALLTSHQPPIHWDSAEHPLPDYR